MFDKLWLRGRKRPDDGRQQQSPQAPARSDALQNNGGTPPRPPNDPNRQSANGPNSGPNARTESATPLAGGNGLGWISRVLVLVLLAFVGLNLYNNLAANSGPPTADISYSDFINEVNGGNVATVTYQTGGGITGTFHTSQNVVQTSGESVTTTNSTRRTRSTTTPRSRQRLLQHGVQIVGKTSSASDFWVNLAINVLPIVALIALLFWLSRRATQSQQNIFNFGRSRAKLIMEDRPSTTFADVAGVDEAKSELEEVVEFLKTPQKFQRLGGKIPKGALLVGPPGTGKTLLARAVAGEAGVPFFSMSGSEFVEVLVGVGASRVRDLFDQAKKAAPSIIFIDEIDAVGRQRGTSLTTNDEREQTLNQLLVEMDGFDTHQAVVVIAATNRPDNLDQALLRPGRFDRRVTVDRPDWKGRKAILEIHSRGVPLTPMWIC